MRSTEDWIESVLPQKLSGLKTQMLGDIRVWGYALDSRSPSILWFAGTPSSGALDHASVRLRACCHGVLNKSVEELASVP